jgi:hypothetical protein
MRTTKGTKKHEMKRGFLCFQLFDFRELWGVSWFLFLNVKHAKSRRFYQ